MFALPKYGGNRNHVGQARGNVGLTHRIETPGDYFSIGP